MLNIVQKPSPNYSKGRSGQKPEAIVIHVMQGSLQGTDTWFGSTYSGVSAHYGVGKNGEVHQYVREEDTAYHAGAPVNPTWILMKSGVNPNSYTIGIEHEGDENTVWSETMINTSARLIREISTRWGIPLDRLHIIGHYEIKSSKPNCPSRDKTIISKLIERAKMEEEMVPVKVPKSKLQKIEKYLANL